MSLHHHLLRGKQHEKLAAFRVALEGKYGIAIDLYCMQILPWIWRHLSWAISSYEDSGVLYYVGRQRAGAMQRNL